MPDPLRVTVHPLSPYAGFDAYQDPPPQSLGNPYAGFESYEEPPPGKPTREIGGGESAERGAIAAGTFGFGPSLSGVAAAGGERPETVAGRSSGEAAMRPLRGAARLIKENIFGKPGEATKAYREARDVEREANEQAFEQNPKSYVGGALGGALLTTPANPLGAATALGRIGESAAIGAGSGALSGAGEAWSRGDTWGDVGKNTAIGGGLGGLIGGGIGSALEGLGAAARRLVSGYRSVRNPDEEALHRVGEALQADRDAGTPPVTPQQTAAARAAGLPLSPLEEGGQATRDLARTAANQSPAAWDAISQFTRERFEGQAPRVEHFINQMFGGLDNPQTAESLKNTYQQTSGPLYRAAYNAGDRPIMSPELGQLVSSPSVGRAMANAVRSGQDRATAQGFGAFRPYVQITPDGRVRFPTGPKGQPAYPNLQLWDYTQRELSDMIGQAQRAGRNSEAQALTQINGRLKAELDRQVPEFRAARASAAEYFGANNALEAGRNFVTSRDDLNEAGRMIQRMSQPERELFARGFAGAFIDQVTNTRDRTNVLNRIAQSPAARRKLVLAMGPQRARQVEAVLNVEALADRSREALGNSTTARQLIRNSAATAGHGAAGAGGVALYEYLSEGGFDPIHVLLGGAALGGIRLHLGHADQEVARRIGEMLVSQDPTIVTRAYQSIANNPRIFNEIRRIALGTASGAARTAGVAPTAGALAAAAQHLHGEGGEHHRGNHPLDNLLDQQQ